jgi:hypothetical protein
MSIEIKANTFAKQQPHAEVYFGTRLLLYASAAR